SGRQSSDIAEPSGSPESPEDHEPPPGAMGAATVEGDAPLCTYDHDDELPERIGRFLIERVVGEGSFGRVYEAYDRWMNRAVALKVARCGHANASQRVERFRREARATAELQHQNIVPVFESGQVGSHYYIASGFVVGKSLDVVLEEHRLQLEQAV